MIKRFDLLIPELHQLIYSFDSTYYEPYQKCLQQIKKNGLYKTLWFTDSNDNNLDYKIANCDCKGELIVKGNGNGMMLNLSNISYDIMEFVSSYGTDEEGSYAAFDLAEFDWSLQRKLFS